MNGKGSHDNSCKCSKGTPCTYDSINIVAPCNGSPCHYSTKGINLRNRQQTPNQGLILITSQNTFQSQGPDFAAQARREWSNTTTPDQIERYLEIVSQHIS